MKTESCHTTTTNSTIFEGVVCSKHPFIEVIEACLNHEEFECHLTNDERQKLIDIKEHIEEVLSNSGVNAVGKKYYGSTDSVGFYISYESDQKAIIEFAYMVNMLKAVECEFFDFRCLSNNKFGFVFRNKSE